MVKKDDPILVSPTATIKEALKQLDLSARRALLVADADGVFRGVLTDGDIRRAILSGKNLDEGIDEVYNKSPKALYEEEYDDETAKRLFLHHHFDLIPILARNRTIARYVSWSEFFSGNAAEGEKAEEPSLEYPLVIMAGGKGTRMAPFTKVLPKPLIPIGDKTILETIIDEFRKYGIRTYFFTLNFRGEMIRAYFDGISRDYTIEYLWEKEFLGTAGRLKLLAPKVPERFFVSNCDIIVKADYRDVAAFHERSGAWITIVSSIQHTQMPYGVVSFGNGGRVTDIKEKPEFSLTINTGVYLLDGRCVEYIPEGKPFHMTDLIASLLEERKPVFTYPVNENDYIDIGQWKEYRDVIQSFERGIQ